MDDALSRDLVDVSRQPEQFIQRSTALQQRLKDVIKRLFDTTKREEADSVSGQSFGPLPELYVDGFDAEQIWEELQLRAFPFLKHAEDESKQLITTLNNNSGVIVAGARKSKARNRSDGVSARSGGHFNDDGGDDRARDDDGDDGRLPAPGRRVCVRTRHDSTSCRLLEFSRTTNEQQNGEHTRTTTQTDNPENAASVSPCPTPSTTTTTTSHMERL